MLKKSARNLYCVDIEVAATAYIKATCEQEALEKARALRDKRPFVLTSDGAVAVHRFPEIDHGDGVPISGRDYSDPMLPDISLSPGMTIHGLWCDGFIETAEEDVP